MDATEDFRVTVDEDARGLVVRVVGDLDATTTPVLRDCLEGVRDRLGAGRLTIDLQGVAFRDHTALWVLASAWQWTQHAGSEMRLRGVEPDAMEMIALVELDRVVEADNS